MLNVRFVVVSGLLDTVNIRPHQRTEKGRPQPFSKVWYMRLVQDLVWPQLAVTGFPVQALETAMDAVPHRQPALPSIANTLQYL